MLLVKCVPCKCDDASTDPKKSAARARRARSRPRHLRRAVLRSGVRVCGHATVAPVARAPDGHGRVADTRAAPRGVVGLDRYLVGHELARPGTHAGAAAPLRAHVS